MGTTYATGNYAAGPFTAEDFGTTPATGRYLVTLDADRAAEGYDLVAAVLQGVGIRTYGTLPAGNQQDFAGIEDDENIYFEQLGIIVAKPAPTEGNALLALADAEGSPVRAVEKERFRFALAENSASDSGAHEAFTVVDTAYLLGFRDGVNAAVQAALGQTAETKATPCPDSKKPVPANVSEAVAATAAHVSPSTGAAIRVAVLDTGVDMLHPDLIHCIKLTRSFVPGHDVQDRHGHGTHCIGLVAGPSQPTAGPRYGIAPGAHIFAGKVLNDQGRGNDAQILAGIEWALTQECKVISLSLGSPTEPDDTYSYAYETVAKRALNRGCTIVAAAGNDSRRSEGYIRRVSSPANCPTIMAVAALRSDETPAEFSNRGRQSEPGWEVDVGAPGVEVLSSFTGGGTRRLSGTSMATPIVAGVLALIAEAAPQSTPSDRWQTLIQLAKPLTSLRIDVGNGLVQAPTN